MRRRIESSCEPAQAGMTTEEFARAIGFHPESVRRCLRAGRLKGLWFGRTYRIPLGEVQRILTHGLPSSPR